MVRYLWYSPQLDLSGVFSWLDRGYELWTFGRKTREVTHHFFIMSYQRSILWIWLIPAGVDIDHLAEVVFLHIVPLSLLSILNSLARSHSLRAAHSQRVRSYTSPPAGRASTETIWNFLHRFVSSPCLLTYLIFHLSTRWLLLACGSSLEGEDHTGFSWNLFYAMGYSPMLIIFLLKWFHFWPLGTFPLVPVFLWHIPILVSLCLFHFPPPPFWHNRCFGLIVYVSHLNPRITYFNKKPYLPLKQTLKTGEEGWE